MDFSKTAEREEPNKTKKNQIRVDESFSLSPGTGGHFCFYLCKKRDDEFLAKTRKLLTSLVDFDSHHSKLNNFFYFLFLLPSPGKLSPYTHTQSIRWQREMIMKTFFYYFGGFWLRYCYFRWLLFAVVSGKNGRSKLRTGVGQTEAAPDM